MRVIKVKEKGVTYFPSPFFSRFFSFVVSFAFFAQQCKYCSLICQRTVCIVYTKYLMAAPMNYFYFAPFLSFTLVHYCTSYSPTSIRKKAEKKKVRVETLRCNKSNQASKRTRFSMRGATVMGCGMVCISISCFLAIFFFTAKNVCGETEKKPSNNSVSGFST